MYDSDLVNVLHNTWQLLTSQKASKNLCAGIVKEAVRGAVRTKT